MGTIFLNACSSVTSPMEDIAMSPGPSDTQYTCKGDWSLGSACGNCDRCRSSALQAAVRMMAELKEMRGKMSGMMPIEGADAYITAPLTIHADAIDIEDVHGVDLSFTLNDAIKARDDELKAGTKFVGVFVVHGIYSIDKVTVKKVESI